MKNEIPNDDQSSEIIDFNAVADFNDGGNDGGFRISDDVARYAQRIHDEMCQEFEDLVSSND